MSAWHTLDDGEVRTTPPQAAHQVPDISPLVECPEAEVNEADAELERNLEVFRTCLPKLLQEHEGQYVVIARGEISAVFETYEAAVKYGYGRFPSVDAHYLLQKVAPIPERADIHMACQVV